MFVNCRWKLMMVGHFFFVLTNVFSLELETKLYYFFITIISENTPVQMGCSMIRKWILKYMTIYELWNSIVFLNFKTSLAIVPHPERHYDTLRTKIDMWLIPYNNFWNCWIYIFPEVLHFSMAFIKCVF